MVVPAEEERTVSGIISQPRNVPVLWEPGGLVLLRRPSGLLRERTGEDGRALAVGVTKLAYPVVARPQVHSLLRRPQLAHLM